MKKFIIGALVIVIMISVFFLQDGTNFKEAVSDVSEITSIEFIRSSNDKEIILENMDEVSTFMNHLSETELKEKAMGSIDFNESYWLTLRVGNDRKYGLTIFDEKFMLIYHYESSKQNSYQIISGFDSSSIDHYFK